jgi:tetratricopeptide (TPR) repeat protein
MPTAAEHINRAYELSRLERHELALQEVQRALEVDPQSAEAHACGAWVLREQGKLADAEQAARAALAADPQLVQAHNALACTLWSRARLPEADAAFKALLACPLDPDRALHLTNYARFLNASRRYHEAVATADRALVLAPTRAGTHEVRGTALYRLGHYAPAEAAFREALRLNPRLVTAHQMLGELALLKGRSSEAFDSFRAALHLEPTNTAAREQLAVALRARHRIYGWLLLLALHGASPRWRRVLLIGILLIVAGPPLVTVIVAPDSDGGWIFDLWAFAIFGLVAVFLISTVWRRIADPLFNTLLQFDPVGRQMLEYDPADGVAAGLLGLTILSGITFVGVALVRGPEDLASAGVAAVTGVSALATLFPYGIRGSTGARRRALWTGFAAAVLGGGIGAAALVTDQDALCGLGFLIGAAGVLVYLVALPGALNTRYGWAAAATAYQKQPPAQRRWQAGLIAIGILTFSLGRGLTGSFWIGLAITVDACFLFVLAISALLPTGTPMHNAPLYKRWVRERGEPFARRSYLVILACATVSACAVTWLLFLL